MDFIKLTITTLATLWTSQLQNVLKQELGNGDLPGINQEKASTGEAWSSNMTEEIQLEESTITSRSRNHALLPTYTLQNVAKQNKTNYYSFKWGWTSYDLTKM